MSIINFSTLTKELICMNHEHGIIILGRTYIFIRLAYRILIVSIIIINSYLTSTVMNQLKLNNIKFKYKVFLLTVVSLFFRYHCIARTCT